MKHNSIAPLRSIPRKHILSAISIALSLVVAHATFGIQQDAPMQRAMNVACDGAYRVLVFNEDLGVPPATLPNLLAEPGISQVDLFDGGAGTTGGFR